MCENFLHVYFFYNTRPGGLTPVDFFEIKKYEWRNGGGYKAVLVLYGMFETLASNNAGTIDMS